MKQIDPKFIERSRDVFLSNAPQSLQDIRECVAARATGTVRRDTLSALDSIERYFGKPLASIRADRKRVRELLASTNGPALSVSPKRYANVCSLVATALQTYGEPVPILTKRIPLTLDWERLLNLIEIRIRRMALHRLACFCSAMKVMPEQVGPEALEGFYAALETEEVVKHPRKVLKYTVAHWNMCWKTVPGWPDFKIETPLENPTAFSFPLSEFPQSFQEDVAAWVERLSNPDPFDSTAPPRALKAVTINGLVLTIRRFATALVHRGELRPDEVTELADFFDIDRFKSGLRFFLKRAEGKITPSIDAMAKDLRNIAKYYCQVDERTLVELNDICRRLDCRSSNQLTEKNRDRLRQFADPNKVARLLAFPADERVRALKLKNPIRATKAMERAVAIGLLINCSLRMQNLRSINLTTDIKWTDGRCFLSFEASAVKNNLALEFELPADLAAMLKEHITTYRPRLPGSEGPYLFPGSHAGPRSHGALALQIKNTMMKHAGLKMNPHLFRHAIAKIVVERNPDLYVAMSRVLGHKRIETTMANYLGTETRAAGRHINRLLKETEAHPALAKD